MSLHALRKGHHVRIGPSEFVILQPLTECRWQLQNIATGEWCTFNEDDLLDRFAKNELSFVTRVEGPHPPADRLDVKLTRDLSTYPPELVALARNRVKYLKEIDQTAANFDNPENHRAARPVRIRKDRGYQASGLAHGLSGLPQMDSRRPRYSGPHLKAR